MKKIFLIFGIALVLLAGTLVVAPGYIDWSKHREQIVMQLHQATGLNFEINGDIELAVIPYPRVKVEGFKVTNPDYQDHVLLNLDLVEASIALKPLFSGQVTVDTVSLIKPQINLEVGAGGEQSWMTDVLRKKRENKGAAENTGGLGDAVSLQSVKIKDAEFIYTDKRSGKTYNLSAVDMGVKADTIMGPYDVDGAVVYQGQKIKLNSQIGRLESNGTLTADAKASIPALSTDVAFSGILSFKNGLEVQGKSDFKTGDLSQILALATKGQPVEFINKPFAVNGMLTASQKAAAITDASFEYAGVKAVGKASINGFADKSSPAALDVLLKVQNDMALDKLLPAGKEKAADAFRFIPETMTLPLSLTAKLDMQAPSVSFRNIRLTEVQWTENFSGKTAKGSVAGKLPGEGKLFVEYGVDFASSSRSEKSGAVTLSDPDLSYKAIFFAKQGAKSLAAVAPQDKIGPLLPLAQGEVSIDTAGHITPGKATLDSGSVKLSGLQLSAKGDYSLKTGRDSLSATFHVPVVDADVWMARLAPKNGNPAASNKSNLPDLAGKLKALALPFDLSLTFTSDLLKYKGVDFENMALKSSLSGKKLFVETLKAATKKGDTLLLSGLVADVETVSGVDVSFEAKSGNLKEFMGAVGMSTDFLPQAIRAANFVAKAEGSLEKLAFTANLDAMQGDFDASGTMTNVSAAPSFSDLTLRVQHPNYVDLVQVFKPDFRSDVAISKKMDLYTTMKRTEGRYEFKEIQATLGPSKISGDISLTLQGVPQADITLKADTFPLDKLLGHDADHKGTVQAAPLRKEQEAKWSRNAIDASWMHKANANISLDADTFSYGPWIVQKANLKSTLQNGTLTVANLSGNLHDGTAVMSGKLVSTGKERIPLEASANVDVQNISIESFVSSFSGSRLVKGKGQVSLKTAVNTTGLSPAALIYGLRGNGTITGKDFVIEGFDLARFSSLLANPSSSMTENVTTLMNASFQGGSTNFSSLDSTYDISEGIVDFTKFLLTGPQANINGDGIINLPLWSLDMLMSVQLIEPADAPPLEVVFKGPLNSPVRTFAKGPMQGYFQKMLGDTVRDALDDSGLGKKLEESGLAPLLEGSGLLPKKRQAPVVQPTETQPTETQPQPAEGPTQDQPVQETPQQPATKQEVKPEDVMRGVLEGILGGQ